MFNPFQEIRKGEARTFSSLPGKFRKKGRTAWSDPNRAGAPVDSFLEGPSFDRDGNLWCVDIPFGRIFRIDPKGEWDLAVQYDGWPNGLKIHRDGRIFIADYKNGIMLLDPVNGKVTPYLVRANLERFKAINDLFFAANGDLYFTDQGLTGLHDATGRVFRVRANGQITCLLDNVPSPNGLVMNRDETILYVAVTRGNCIWRVPFTRSGEVAKVGLYIQMSGGGGPDGLALDDEGRLLVAHVGMGSVWVFDAHGEPVYRIQSCAGRATTNLAFGGPDNKTLYITESESASILTAQLDVSGKLMYSHT
jgi:gluconolactonase